MLPIVPDAESRACNRQWGGNTNRAPLFLSLLFSCVALKGIYRQDAMSFFKSCTPEQRKALAAAQKATGVQLKDANPANPEFQNTSGGLAVTAFLSENYPAIWADFRSSSTGFSLSLESVMYDRGEIELTKEIHDWKMENDSAYRIQQVEKNRLKEERILQEMEASANKSWEARTGRPADERDRPNFALYGKQAAAMERQWIQQQLMADD